MSTDESKVPHGGESSSTPGAGSGSAAGAGDAAEEAAAMAALVELQGRVTSKSAREMPPLPLPGRRIVKEGILLKKGNKSLIKSTGKRRVFLCNDVLLAMTDEKRGTLAFHTAVNLHGASLRDLQHANVDTGTHKFPELSFEVVSTSRTLLLFADSPDTKAEWMTAIRGVLENLAREADGFDEFADPGWRHRSVSGTLWSAALTGDEAMAQSLLQFAAAEEGEVVGRCKRYVPLGQNDTDADGRAPIHLAAMFGHPRLVRLLLEFAADGNMNDPDQKTPLHLAVIAGHMDVVTVLLDNDVKLEKKDFVQSTPLMAALSDCKRPELVMDMVRLLLARGADATTTDCEGATPLHVVAITRYSELVPDLLQAGANPHAAIPGTGFSPLHTACSEDEMAALVPKTVEKLLQIGVMPNGRDNHGATALHMIVKQLVASSAKDASAATEVLHLLLRYGARCDIQAIPGDAKSTVQAQISEAGMTSLWTAMQRSMAQHSSRRAPAEAEAPISANPLHRVCEHQQPDSVSPGCQICGAKFSFTRRRHHCRFCGLLVCDACSTKRYPLFGSGDALTPQRVDDGCFNRLTTETRLGPPTAERFTAFAPTATRDADAEHKADREALMAGAGGGGAGADGESAVKAHAAASVDVSGVRETMDRTMRAAAERGERINRLAEKTQQMADDARDFEAAARRLRESMQ